MRESDYTGGKLKWGSTQVSAKKKNIPLREKDWANSRILRSERYRVGQIEN